MRRYIRAMLGGLLAVLAAFGWVVTILVGLTLASRDAIWGIELPRGHGAIVALIPVFLIFSAGFYVAFRAAYRKDCS